MFFVIGRALAKKGKIDESIVAQNMYTEIYTFAYAPSKHDVQQYIWLMRVSCRRQLPVCMIYQWISAQWEIRHIQQCIVTNKIIDRLSVKWVKHFYVENDTSPPPPTEAQIYTPLCLGMNVYLVRSVFICSVQTKWRPHPCMTPPAAQTILLYSYVLCRWCTHEYSVTTQVSSLIDELLRSTRYYYRYLDHRIFFLARNQSKDSAVQWKRRYLYTARRAVSCFGQTS